MQKFALIFIASGAGGVARYVIGGWVQKLASASFPLGTLLINVSGCLLVGFLAAALSGRWLVREEYRLAVLIGFVGGYTTFSTFGLETFALLNDGQYVRAAGNIVLSVALGLSAVWAGYRFAERWLGA